MKRTPYLILVLTAAIFNPTWAQLRMADIFTDHAVLQQNTTVPVWGWSKPGSNISVNCSWIEGQHFKAKTDATGKWRVALPTPSASLTPHQLMVTDGQNNILLSDLLIGEVWLCSGQSNMEWEIKDSGYTPEQTKAEEYPFIRHFKVNHAVSLVPLDTLDAGEWQVCDAESARYFSGVAYFFARELADRYQIPIGLVHSSWGGSQVESWISGEGMANSTLFKEYWRRFPETWAEADQRSLGKVKKYLLGNEHISPTPEEEAAYLQKDYDIGQWRKVNPTFAWDWQQIWAFRGSGFMAIDVDLNNRDIAQSAQLHLGRSDLSRAIYWNGQLIWSGHQQEALELILPASSLQLGKNRLLVKQILGDARGWVEMGLKGPADLFYLKTTSRKISLAEPWSVMASFNEPLHFIHSSNNLGVAVYNAMIHPIQDFPIQGVIWYQGETNAGRAFEYRQSFPLLIQDWRRIWGSAMPFLFVQLANYEAGNGNSNTGSEWAELREAQAFALRLPNTGMAVTIDIGESKDIHPKNKHDVGKRLAWEAMRVAYGEDLPTCSPLNPVLQFQGDSVIISFPEDTPPLTVHDKYGYVNGFELAGENQRFHYAKAELSGQRIIVRSSAVAKPLAVRYAWADDPYDVNLFTTDGFPIAPFRSDDWKCVTEGRRFE
ncbi:MAG TPA: sialate O-acetylesterase [Saprospiraceae bacterium]|nr:sialate O-acetylesterase [Saprospiraceae bacterium]HMQ84837.1 sialate O-acetylesterase [Saprospiraceae bacterium]